MKECKFPSLPQITPIEPAGIPRNFAENAGEWLVKYAAQHLSADGTRYALIHADDGVLWGKVNGNRLIVPDPSDWSPELRAITVQQCRVFGGKGELFIWRVSDGKWRGRVVIESDEAKDSYKVINEPHILNGDRVFVGSNEHPLPPFPDGFTPIYERGTGIRQIVPKEVAEDDFNQNKRVVLRVRHYLRPDDDGQARFHCSRLVDVELLRNDKTNV